MIARKEQQKKYAGNKCDTAHTAVLRFRILLPHHLPTDILRPKKKRKNAKSIK